MNSFANSVFSLLFGWARSLIWKVWTAAASGSFSGFFTWLGDHWLWLALLLALAGTVIDLAVWLFRWRPYLVWRTDLRRFTRSLSQETRSIRRRFAQGFQGGLDGVDMDLSGQEAPAGEEEEAWAEAAWAQPPEELAREPEKPAPEEPRQGRQRPFPAKQGDGLLPPFAPSWLGRAYRSDLPASPRKRRSEKFERKKPEWMNKFMIGEVEEDTLLDSLPPAVDRELAFHEPVYPDQSQAAGAYTGWQPPAGNSTEGNQKE